MIIPEEFQYERVDSELEHELDNEEEGEPETQTEPEAKSDIEYEAQPEIEPKFQPEFGIKVEAQIEPEVEFEVQPEKKSEFEPKAGIDVEAEREPKFETESEPEPDNEYKVQRETVPKLETEADVEVETETDISQSGPRTREPRKSYFSCYRTHSSPVVSYDMSEMNAVFDTCEETDLMEMMENGAKIKKSGKYQLSFTALMKSTGYVPITVNIRRLRSSEEQKLIGTNMVNLSSKQGKPEVGLSSSVFMMEELEEDDILEITQSTSNGSSFLRSSDWNLLRLEGHRAGQTGKNLSNLYVFCLSEYCRD